MIAGFVKVEGGAVVTHRDSYLLNQLSVVSVRRPFFVPAALIALAHGGFALSFFDLLYSHELIILAVLGICAPVILAQVGQLKLLSRDLRGSELSGVIWGQFSALNQTRTEIVQALSAHQREALS